jgi:neutral ceramidase
MGRLMAAAREMALLPPAGGWMSGYAARVVPSVGTHDALMAHAVLLDDGENKLAIVSCDLIGFTPAAVADMRRRIAAQSTIAAKHILIACTHTHSGPASMPFRGVLGYVDEQWLMGAQDSIVALVAGLDTKLMPAQWAHAATRVDGIGYNRQDQARPIDNELHAIAISTTEGAPLVTIANYATHAVVLGPNNLLFSGDFPGATARQLQQQQGGIGIYLQGTCGDVDPAINRDRGWATGTFADCEEIGRRLAIAAGESLSHAPWNHEMRLCMEQRMVEIPLDPPPSVEALGALVAGFEAERLQAQREPANPIQEQTALAMLGWAKEMEQAIQAHTVAQALIAEMFVVDVGDLCIIGVPFETYSDIGMRIKQALAPKPVFLVGYANGLYGYCPSRWAKEQGGYGPDSSARWFPELLTAIGYGADERLIGVGVS